MTAGDRAVVRSQLDDPAREVFDLLDEHPVRADQLRRHRRTGNGGRR